MNASLSLRAEITQRQLLVDFIESNPQLFPDGADDPSSSYGISIYSSGGSIYYYSTSNELLTNIKEFFGPTGWTRSVDEEGSCDWTTRLVLGNSDAQYSIKVTLCRMETKLMTVQPSDWPLLLDK